MKLIGLLAGLLADHFAWRGHDRRMRRDRAREARKSLNKEDSLASFLAASLTVNPRRVFRFLQAQPDHGTLRSFHTVAHRRENVARMNVVAELALRDTSASESLRWLAFNANGKPFDRITPMMREPGPWPLFALLTNYREIADADVADWESLSPTSLGLEFLHAPASLSPTAEAMCLLLAMKVETIAGSFESSGREFEEQAVFIDGFTSGHLVHNLLDVIASSDPTHCSFRLQLLARVLLSGNILKSEMTGPMWRMGRHEVLLKRLWRKLVELETPEGFCARFEQELRIHALRPTCQDLLREVGLGHLLALPEKGASETACAAS